MLLLCKCWTKAGHTDRHQPCSCHRHIHTLLCGYGLSSFGPTAWNALGNDLRDQELSITSFGHLFKTHVSEVFSALSTLEAQCDNALYKLTLTLAFLAASALVVRNRLSLDSHHQQCNRHSISKRLSSYKHSKGFCIASSECFIVESVL